MTSVAASSPAEGFSITIRTLLALGALAALGLAIASLAAPATAGAATPVLRPGTGLKGAGRARASAASSARSSAAGSTSRRARRPLRARDRAGGPPPAGPARPALSTGSSARARAGPCTWRPA